MPRILIVDDQKIPRVAVAGILEEAGHEVATAGSGAEGLRLAKQTSPDVVVLDVYMPDMDGFETVERLKADPETAPTPVIFLTAGAPDEDLIVRGLELGAYDFLSKGCSRAELLARVGVMARIKRSNDELSAVARISDTLIQSLDPYELGQRFADQVRDIFRSAGVLLAYRADPKLPPQYAVAGFDAEPPMIEALAQALHEAVDSRTEIQAELEAEDLQGPAGVLTSRVGFESILATRLEHGNRPPTLLAVFANRGGRFARQSDAPLLHLLARQATIALDNALLHERTQAQAKAMEEQALQLERAMTERSRFFASMSHELRTPINAVIGFNQLLEIGAYGDLTGEQLTAVARVSRSAQHLLELVNDILDISKLEAGKMQFSPQTTNLARLIEETVTTVQIQAQEKGLELDVDTPTEATTATDPARVRQILLNLLSNAIKFTEAGRVTVRLQQLDDLLEVSVSDTGPGIAPEDHDRVFEEFEQTHRTPSGAGTGLGLPISKRLAELLGGELELHSELGKGSTFVLKLPLQEETPDAGREEQSERGSAPEDRSAETAGAE
ncbi:MAG: ATP-binding protein [Gemmatimonadota bacterium]